MTHQDADLLRRLLKRRFVGSSGVKVVETPDTVSIAYVGPNGQRAQTPQIVIRLTAGTGPYTGWHQERPNANSDGWEKITDGVSSASTGIDAIAVGNEEDLKIGETDGCMGYGRFVYGPDGTPILLFVPFYDDSGSRLALAGGASETAQTDTFERNNQSSGKSGFTLTICTRVIYNSSGNEVLYYFSRDIEVNAQGLIIDVSEETRNTVNTPEDC